MVLRPGKAWSFGSPLELAIDGSSDWLDPKALSLEWIAGQRQPSPAFISVKSFPVHSRSAKPQSAGRLQERGQVGASFVRAILRCDDLYLSTGMLFEEAGHGLPGTDLQIQSGFILEQLHEPIRAAHGLAQVPGPILGIDRFG